MIAVKYGQQWVLGTGDLVDRMYDTVLCVYGLYTLTYTIQLTRFRVYGKLPVLASGSV